MKIKMEFNKEIPDHYFSYNRALKSVEIPNRIAKIGRCAFSGCGGLTKVSFEENSELTVIEAGTFSRCYKLAEITIPKSVKGIEEMAFFCCSCTIKYLGTKEEWDKIDKDKLWDKAFTGTIEFLGEDK